MEEQSNFQGAERNFKVTQTYTKTFREVKQIIASMTKEQVSIKNFIQKIRKKELLDIKKYNS